MMRRWQIDVFTWCALLFRDEERQLQPVALLSIVHEVRQRIFSRSDQIYNDTAEGKEDAVLPATVRFAGVIPTIFKMYGTGAEGHCG